jgi:hypothetical protein
MTPTSSAIANASNWSWVTRSAGDARILQDRAHLDRQALAQVDVEVAERLVEQQELGLRRQRARQRDALLLAARQLVRVRARRVGQADELEHAVRARRRARRAELAKPNATLRDTSRCGNSA